MKSLLNISKEEAIKKLKSLGWRAGMMVLSMVIAFLIENLSALTLPPQVTVVLGLILGEVSKIINKNLQGLKKLAGK